MVKIIKKTNWYFVGLVIAILLFILVIGILSSYHPFYTKKVTDEARINDLQYLETHLDKYYSQYNFFPTSLTELSKLESFLGEKKYLKFSPEKTLEVLIMDPKTKKEYLYAFYPPENPTSYHLGAILELAGEDTIIVEGASLKNDADFNSATAGYVNGFDGKDPVYDLHIKK